MPAKITIPEIGHWYFIFTLSPVWWENYPEKVILQLGFFKVLARPPGGEMYEKHHYKGFWIRKTFNWPAFGFSHNFKSNDYDIEKN